MFYPMALPFFSSLCPTPFLSWFTCRLLLWSGFPACDGSWQHQCQWLLCLGSSAEKFPPMSESSVLPSVLLAIFAFTSRHNLSTTARLQCPGCGRWQRTSHRGWWGPRRWSWWWLEGDHNGASLVGSWSSEQTRCGLKWGWAGGRAQ